LENVRISDGCTSWAISTAPSRTTIRGGGFSARVVRDAEGKVYTVRYEAVNAMLLNEFLKEHRKVDKLEATVADLVATVKEQAAQIQKVSAQLEVKKPAPKVVRNNPKSRRVNNTA